MIIGAVIIVFLELLAIGIFNPSVSLKTESQYKESEGLFYTVVEPEKIAGPTLPTLNYNFAKPESSEKILGTSTKAPAGISKQSLLQALNSYRENKGAGKLRFDSKLQSYAQSRAEYLKSLGKLDQHAGHQEFMKDGGFEKLGFNSIAENQSYNFKGSSQDLIESFYGKSSGHNKNQLNPEYTDVGIGISGAFTNLVFGGKKK